MKKILYVLLTMILCISLVACGEKSASNKTNDLTNDAETSTTENIEATTKKEIKELTAEEIGSQLSEQELKIISTKYTVQDKQYKALYPDVMQVILKNDTEYDIKNALIAFVAWDENNLPVQIKASVDFGGGSYVKECEYPDINLIPGGTFGDTYGFEVDDTCNIKNFKAIVVSYEAFTGETWHNPLYEEWRKLYEGVKLTPEMMTN